MVRGAPGDKVRLAVREMLGYLNFSAGAADATFRRNTNTVFGWLETSAPQRVTPTRVALRDLLLEELDVLACSVDAFEHAEQARQVIVLGLDRLPAAYRQHHRDLLFHQTDDALFGPLFLCRMLEAVLAQGAPWSEASRIVNGALGELNDFIGHRPIATLETEQKLEPYAHEWVAPVPLYFRDAGVGIGVYQALVAHALDTLRQTDPDILRRACFDPELLDELAFDPRAYDFDHPVNKRPNYQFGQWDPHRIDQQGRYRRFVLVQVTLDALLGRVNEAAPEQRQQWLVEAAAVLAGTMLMAAAVSGSGPDAHDSSVTLATLVPQIAVMRDDFYVRLLDRVPGEHGQRLRAEAAALRQPLGGARQHLNHTLARLRATQLQHVHLAQLFATMGYSEASRRQASFVPVASARMLCEIHSLLAGAQQAVDRGQVAEASRALAAIEDLLKRAIECGAMVDPWNILGFQGQFSLFPAMENSVHDHRVDVLLHLVEQVFALFVRLNGEAAALGDEAMLADLKSRLGRLAAWWDRFASVAVGDSGGILGREIAESAAQIAAALGAWHEGGEAAGAIGFWRRHVAHFNSPKSYAQVVQALLDRRDFVAAMALLMHWLSCHEQVELDDGRFSLFDLAIRWLSELHAGDEQPAADAPSRWELSGKFFDYLEANAEEYWEVPRFQWSAARSVGDGDARDPDEEPDSPFGAAYEGVVYRDTTGDGHEGSTLEGGADQTRFELEAELHRLGKRLAFHHTLGILWKLAAAAGRHVEPHCRDEHLRGWCRRALDNQQRLLDLLGAVHRHPLPTPSGTADSLVEYDRRRQIKETLLAEIARAYNETADAARLMLAAMDDPPEADTAPWERHAVCALRAMFRGEADALRRQFPELRAALDSQPILYVPLAKGGQPQALVAAQSLQRVLRRLLEGMPRLGLLAETCRLLVTAQSMERHRPAADGAVTEFDRLFESGYTALVESLVDIAEREQQAENRVEDHYSSELVDCLQTATEGLLKRWHEHSRMLRLSVLEKAADKWQWEALKRFIEQYGHDLFTPRFMNLGNLRAILHQRVDVWLDRLGESPDAEQYAALLADLGGSLDRRAAVEHLSLVIEAVAENYAEYKDFNSTTTQSDRGELLYTLLDFLRLKASYDRFAWNIRPVVMAHEVLVRRGKTSTAELWRRAVAERTAEVADWHLSRLGELSRRYGMRLPTISDRLEERFVRPLTVDLVRVLVRPAMEEACQGRPSVAFNLLEQEIRELAQHPTGSGLDVPEWLLALEAEVGQATAARWRRSVADSFRVPPGTVALSWEHAHQQLCDWEEDA